MLPANYTFTASDQGMHTFSGGVTLFTAGTQTVTVQDTANGSITGSASITVSAGATTQLVVSAAASAVAGSPFDVTVTVLDSDGNVVIGYSGTVTFSSSDPFPGVLPADYTFTSSDQGTHTFPGGVTLFTAGGQTLTVQDTANSSLTGSAPWAKDQSASASNCSPRLGSLFLMCRRRSSNFWATVSTRMMLHSTSSPRYKLVSPHLCLM
jgi:hypothetical protein